jgi:hypothetical protein
VGRAGERGSLSLSYRESSLPLLEVVSEEGRSGDCVFEDQVSKDACGEERRVTPPPGDRGVGGARERVPGRTDDVTIPGYRHSFLQRQLSADDLKRASPNYLEDEPPVSEVWVASSDARHSTITVIDYAQQFTQIEVRFLTHALLSIRPLSENQVEGVWSTLHRGFVHDATIIGHPGEITRAIITVTSLRK